MRKPTSRSTVPGRLPSISAPCMTLVQIPLLISFLFSSSLFSFSFSFLPSYFFFPFISFFSLLPFPFLLAARTSFRRARLPSCSLEAYHMAGQVPYHLVPRALPPRATWSLVPQFCNFFFEKREILIVSDFDDILLG